MNKMDMPYVVGVDVGGQTTKIGVVDMRGQVLAQTVIRTDTYAEVDPYIGELAEAITKVVADAGVTGQVRGIGMGIPNGNYYTGEIENAVNLKWGNKGIVPVAKLLKDKMNGVPVALTNDANAIVVAKGGMTYGVGAGQMNRIGSAEIALKQAQNTLKEEGKDIMTEGLVLASDGFFPFNDCVALAAEYGIKAIVQPGGSIRDEDSIKLANEKGITMLFTGERHFKH